jgi:hypothetical protein
MSDRQLDRAPEPTAPGLNRWVRRAWVGVALIPVFFFIAFAVGEVVYALLGYEPEDADAPVWAVVVASAVVVVVVLVPCVAAVHFGRRAVKAGDRHGVYPAVIGAVAAVGWVALTIVSEVGNVVRR